MPVNMLINISTLFDSVNWVSVLVLATTGLGLEHSMSIRFPIWYMQKNNTNFNAIPVFHVDQCLFLKCLRLLALPF